LRVSRGRTALSLQCVGQWACRIEVTLASSRAGGVAEDSGAAGSLARARRTIPADQSRRISIALTRSGLSLLRAQHGRIGARLVIDGMAGVAPVHLSRTVSLAVRPASR
jgi:hypothetical protein